MRRHKLNLGRGTGVAAIALLLLASKTASADIYSCGGTITNDPKPGQSCNLIVKQGKPATQGSVNAGKSSSSKKKSVSPANFPKITKVRQAQRDAVRQRILEDERREETTKAQALEGRLAEMRGRSDVSTKEIKETERQLLNHLLNLQALAVELDNLN